VPGWPLCLSGRYGGDKNLLCLSGFKSRTVQRVAHLLHALRYSDSHEYKKEVLGSCDRASWNVWWREVNQHDATNPMLLSSLIINIGLVASCWFISLHPTRKKFQKNIQLVLSHSLESSVTFYHLKFSILIFISPIYLSRIFIPK